MGNWGLGRGVGSKQPRSAFRCSPAGCQVSIRACEMEAIVRVFQRDRSVPVDAVAKELQQVLAKKACHGVIV